MRRILVAIALGAALLAAGTPGAGAAEARPRWDTRLLARVPAPGYPAHAYVHPNGRVYAGTFVNPGHRGPSRVFEYTGEGQLLRSWEVAGQRLADDHGVQAATSDARGRLVLLSHAPARVLLLDRRTGEQATYATFPALGGSGEAVPNYAAWGPDGSLYVTDYGNNVVWRVPPGGGTATLWLQDPKLQPLEFGTTGIELAADRRTLLIAQQTSPASGNRLAGGLFASAIEAGGSAGPLRRVWESRALDLADGFALARSGRVYVAALGPNQVVVLSPEAREQERFPQAPLLGENSSGTPFDTLSSVAFLGTRLITASQSNPRGEPTHWALHDVEAGEEGLPELIPANAGLRPGERAAKANPNGKKKKRKRKARKRQRAVGIEPAASPGAGDR